MLKKINHFGGAVIFIYHYANRALDIKIATFKTHQLLEPGDLHEINIHQCN